MVGLDDIPETAFMFPPLTTVRPEFAEVGRRCITVMLDHIHGRPCSWMRSVVVRHLIVRGSSCPAAHG